MSHTPPAPGQLYELREWLLDRIDGGEEMRGEDGLVSDFIRQIDAATAELADLKQRLLPQYIGRAERAQRERQMISHERDSLLEKLRAATSMPCAPSATAAPDRPDWARQLPGAEIYDRAARGDHGYDRTASLSAGRYVCLCGGTCSHHDAEGRPE